MTVRARRNRTVRQAVAVVADLVEQLGSEQQLVEATVQMIERERKAAAVEWWRAQGRPQCH